MILRGRDTAALYVTAFHHIRCDKALVSNTYVRSVVTFTCILIAPIMFISLEGIFMANLSQQW